MRLEDVKNVWYSQDMRSVRAFVGHVCVQVLLLFVWKARMPLLEQASHTHANTCAAMVQRVRGLQWELGT